MATFSAILAPSIRLLPWALLGLVVYTTALYVYRIFFSPLSHIPGPKLAAATRWYECYFDAIKVGRYYAEIERMHKVYGKARIKVEYSGSSSLTRDRTDRPCNPLRSSYR